MCRKTDGRLNVSYFQDLMPAISTIIKLFKIMPEDKKTSIKPFKMRY